MSTRAASQRGRDREVMVARLLEADDWLVASRRHVGGAGDLLAVRLHPTASHYTYALGTAEVRLIEVKSTTGGPYERFGPVARQAMIEAAGRVNAEAYLAWWPARRGLAWIRWDEWPG